MKKRARTVVFFSIAISVAIFVCIGIIVINANEKHEPVKRGLFSWKSDVFTDAGNELFSFMKLNGFNELYQWFSSDLNDFEITGFLNNAVNEGIDVYLLTGDPSWANDSSGKRSLEMVEKAFYLRNLTSKSALKGIIFDIEPYSQSQWEQNKSQIFENYLLGMKKAYSKAVFYGFEVVTCIPNNYEELLSDDELKAFIRTTCDRVAVMNYKKGGEIETIKDEIEHAEDYRKEIVNIYEFKAPGDRGVSENNTYYSDGFDAALLNFAELCEAYQSYRINITMAAHDYEALREVLK